MSNNADTPPSADKLTRIQFTETIADVSWYRHESWQPGQYKRFRHFHTMSQDITGFEFYNESQPATDQRGGKD